METTFDIQPYSVIDTRSGHWLKRKKEWRETIGRSFYSREGKLYDSLAMRMPRLYAASKEYRDIHGLSFEEYIKELGADEIHRSEDETWLCGVSEFDPTLAEIIYKWYTPHPNSRIFDCFAGGVTKGAVAGICGHQFFGIELRPEQVEVNQMQVDNLGVNARYIVDDAKHATAYLGVATQDLLFTCPPYYNLEVYSSMDGDLSNMPTYTEFRETLQIALTNSLQCLKANRFAVIVVSDVRTRNGAYYGLPEDVIAIMRGEGCHLWNDIVIVNNTNAILMKRLYKTRKVARCHQRALVFYKGNPAHISNHFKNIT